MVSELRAAREQNANVAYQTFIKLIREDESGSFWFFEGKDSPYYMLRIKQIIDGTHHPIVCRGKKMVLKVFDLISEHEEYVKYNKGFFVDRDFDPPINVEIRKCVYETPCYSVENLYVSVSTFVEILKNELNLSVVNESYASIVTNYETLLHQYVNSILLFNSWYSCLIDRRNRCIFSTMLPPHSHNAHPRFS